MMVIHTAFPIGVRETAVSISSDITTDTSLVINQQPNDKHTQDPGRIGSLTTKKRKPRRKPARKRTPKTAIIPCKRASSTDDIQDNIHILNSRYHSVKAKRRRLYVREQKDGQCHIPVTDGLDKMDQDVPMKQRLLPTRKSKATALLKLQEQDIPFPDGAYCKKNIKDLENVVVAIAPSSIPHAGLGLFLLAGPAEDGSAPTGTRVALYDGIHFRTKAEQELVRSDKYKSAYVWEGLNPFTGETVIVDGSPLNSYGPYMNDGLDHREANATLVFGSDGKIYVETITTVSRYSELLLSYGHQYWLDPALWDTLPEDTKISILNYYKCDPPRTTRPSI